MDSPRLEMESSFLTQNDKTQDFIWPDFNPHNWQNGF